MGFHLVSGGRQNLWPGKFDIFPEEIFVHGISTRHGGVSTGQWDSLNLGLHVEDVPEHVVENRRRFAAALGVKAENIVTCQQVHGDRIARVTEKDLGAGSVNFAQSIPDTDALVTNVPGMPLMLFFADCVPILLADPVHRAVGLAHGGWKGTVQSIGAKTVQRMAKEFGSRPEDMVAAIGPSIGSCCYQVGAEVADKFRAAFPAFADRILTEKDGDIRLNLQLANGLQLEAAGLKKENIAYADVCTACNNRQFFSYRADMGKTGRIAAVIGVK